uniref:TRAF3-interacting protein 1 N-terminal domain-containing protein n=1 Tax=Trichuris muris TaxID=70415 RepID=A0A5S6QHS8_TRIMR
MGDQDFVRPTQKALRHLVDKTPLTEKLLSRPPFQYIRSIVASVVRATGYMANLFTNDDLYTKEIVTKEFKLLFLRNVIAAVEQTLNKTVEAKPGKIIAGLEPEITNKFLQDLAEAATRYRSRRRSREKAVVQEHAQLGSKRESKGTVAGSKVNGRLSVPKEHGKDKRKQSKDSSGLIEKSSKEAMTKKGKEILENGKRRDSSGSSSLPATGKEKHKNARRRSSIDKRKEAHRNQRDTIVAQPTVPIATVEASPTEVEEPIGQEIEKTDSDEELIKRSVPLASNVASNFSTSTEAKPSDPENVALDSFVTRPIPVAPAGDDQLKRPPSRLSTARTAPPRVVSKVVEELPAGSSKATGALEADSSKALLDDHDEGPDLWGTAAPVAHVSSNDASMEGGGRLVHKILETKKQLEEEALLTSQPTGYLMVTDDEEAAQVRKLTTKLMQMIQQFAKSVQTTSSNFGLLMESAQNFDKEWNGYRKETEKLAKRLEELKQQDDPVETSLNEQLVQLDSDIEKRLRIFYALRKRLLENEAKIYKWLNQ